MGKISKSKVLKAYLTFWSITEMGLSFNGYTNCQLTRDRCYKSNRVTKIALFLLVAIFVSELFIGLKHEIIPQELKGRAREYKQHNLQFESEDDDGNSWMSNIWLMLQHSLFGKNKRIITLKIYSKYSYSTFYAPFL